MKYFVRARSGEKHSIQIHMLYIVFQNIKGNQDNRNNTKDAWNKKQLWVL